MKSILTNKDIVFLILIPLVVLSLYYSDLFRPYSFANFPKNEFEMIFAMIYLSVIEFPGGLALFIASFYAILSSNDLKQYLYKVSIPIFLTTVFHIISHLLMQGLSYFNLDIFFIALVYVPTLMMGSMVGWLYVLIKTGRFLRLFQSSVHFYLLLFICTLVMSVFSGTLFFRVTTEMHQGKNLYYINRGVPFVYSGVAYKDAVVTLPFVRLPTSYYEKSLSTYTKIFDMRFFAVSMIFYLFVALPFVSAIYSKISSPWQLFGTYIVLILALIYAINLILHSF